MQSRGKMNTLEIVGKIRERGENVQMKMEMFTDWKIFRERGKGKLRKRELTILETEKSFGEYWLKKRAGLFFTPKLSRKRCTSVSVEKE